MRLYFMTLWPLKRMAQGSQAQTILRAAGSMRCWCSPANGVLHISQHSTVGRLRTNWRSVAKARSFWPAGVSGELTSHSHAPWPAAARPLRRHSPAAAVWVRDARYPNPCCQQMVRATLGLTKYPEPEDAADALAIALCHAHAARAQQRVDVARAMGKKVADSAVDPRAALPRRAIPNLTNPPVRNRARAARIS